MPTLRDVKNRIRSVQSTRRITKAMEMVAAKKFRWCNTIWGKSSSIKFLLLILLVATVPMGQIVAKDTATFGVRLGGSWSTMSGTPVPNPSVLGFDRGSDLSPKIGYIAGVYFTIPTMNHISLQPELNLIYHRTDASFTNSDPGAIYSELTDKLKLLYLEIPILIKYKLSARRGASLFVGPAIFLSISAKDEIENSGFINFFGIVPEPDITNVSKTGLSLVIGGDYQFTMGSHELLVDLRYTHSFNNTFHNIDRSEVPSFIPSTNDFPDEIPLVSQSGDASDLKNRAITLSIGLSL